MPVTIDGTTGITTPSVASTGASTFTGALALPSGGLNVGSGQLAVSASGRVTMSSQPFFTAAWSGGVSDGKYTSYYTSQQTITGSVYPYQNTGNNMNTSTGIYTCPVAGKYLVQGVYSNDSGTLERNIGHLWVNNVFWGEWCESYGLYDDTTVVRILSLQANDTLQFGQNVVFVWNRFGVTITLLG